MITGVIHEKNGKERLKFFKELGLGPDDLEKIKKSVRELKPGKYIIFNIYGKDDRTRLRDYWGEMKLTTPMTVIRKFVHCLNNLNSLTNNSLIIIYLPEYDAGPNVRNI